MLALDKLPYTIYVTDQNGNEVTNYTIDEDGTINFNNDLLSGATPITKLTITVTPKYALKKNITNCTETITVIPNDGVNVYTSAELYDAFADTTVHTINLMRTIVAELHPDQSYNGEGQYIDNEWENGIYVRVPTAANDTLTLNGNCYTVDASRLPLLDPEKGGLPTHNSEEYSGDSTYRLICAHTGIFNYYAADLAQDDSLATPTMTVNDLFLHGNFNGNGSALSGSITEGVKPLLVGGQTLHGFEARQTHLNLNNTRIDYTNSAIITNGFTYTGGNQPGNPTKLFSSVVMDGVTIDHSFANAFYAWGQVGVDVKDSYLGQCSGAIFQFDDTPIVYTSPYTSYLNLADDVTLENFVSGSEAWFVAYGLGTAAADLKMMANGMLYPASITKEVIAADGTKTEYFNFIMCTRDSTGFDDLSNTVQNEQASVIPGINSAIPFVPVFKGTVGTLNDMYMGLSAGDNSPIAGMNAVYIPYTTIAAGGMTLSAGKVSLFVQAFIPGMQ